MALSHARIAINDSTPTIVTVVGAESKVNCTVQVQNLGTEAVYLGASNLTATSYGVSIVPGGAVTIDNLAGGNYSQYSYDITSATKQGIIYPSLDPCIFEVRYPDTDIYGRIVAY